MLCNSCSKIIHLNTYCFIRLKFNPTNFINNTCFHHRGLNIYTKCVSCVHAYVCWGRGWCTCVRAWVCVFFWCDTQTAVWVYYYGWFSWVWWLVLLIMLQRITSILLCSSEVDSICTCVPTPIDLYIICISHFRTAA